MSESGFKYIERKKVSKAQKRRDAKEAKRVEQVKRIEETEILDENKEGRIEQEKFKRLLDKYNLDIHEIDADGDCLYKAVEHQLSLTSDSPNERLTFQDLREQTSSHMLDHKDDFLPFLTNDQGDCMSDAQFQTYCDRIARTKEWGGHCELTAISQITKKPIHVYQADQKRPITIEPSQSSSDKKPMLLSFHKHLYGLGEHYNSLVERKTT